MTATGIIAAWLLTAAIGVGWAWVLLPKRWRAWWQLLLFAVPLGTGATSLSAGTVIAVGGYGAWLLMADVLAGLLLVPAAYARQRLADQSTPALQASSPTDAAWGDRLPMVAVAIAAGVVCCSGLIGAITVMGANPLGQWDAWVMHNLKASLLHGPAGLWAINTAPHPDYPLLMPLVIAKHWAYAGAQAPLAPQAASIVWTVWLFASVGAACAWCRGAWCGVWGVLAMACCPHLFYWAGLQYLDIPLVCFMVLAVWLLLAASRSETAAWLTGLAGVFAGFTAWTKNEGQLFCALLIAASAFSRGRRFTPRLALAALIGAVPGLIASALVKGLADSPPSVSRGSPVNLLDLDRWQAFLSEYGWLLWHRLPFVAFLLLMVGLAVWPSIRRSRDARPLLIALGLGLIYLAIWVSSSADPGWYVSTTWDRLLISQFALLVVGLAALRIRHATAPQRLATPNADR